MEKEEEVRGAKQYERQQWQLIQAPAEDVYYVGRQKIVSMSSREVNADDIDISYIMVFGKLHHWCFLMIDSKTFHHILP